MMRERDLSRLEAIAIEAGNAIMALRATGFEKAEKTDGSPVTAADLAADEIIRKGLSVLAPDVPAITEETFANEKDEAEPVRYWCVDPLDGTKGFINGGRDFTVNIALIEGGYPVLGVIYAPAVGMLWGGSGGKAWKREAPPSAPPSADMTLEGLGEAVAIRAKEAVLDKPAVVATKAHRSPQLEAWIAAIGAGAEVSVGSSLKFCMLAEGGADLYPRLGATMEWDTAAGQAILEAAGGCVFGADGMRFYYGKAGRLNGSFTAVARVEGGLPEAWCAPQKPQAGSGSRSGAGEAS